MWLARKHTRAAYTEIGEYFDQPIHSYSSGMRTRLGFGMSMAFDFDYYLIDEVMAVGDARFKAKSRELLRARLERAHVIIVSHSMDDIKRLCNVVVMVQDGQAMLYENVREGIRAYQATGDSMPRLSQQKERKRAIDLMKQGKTREAAAEPPLREDKHGNGGIGGRGRAGQALRKKARALEAPREDAE
jgi:capsular polysaccharide transport system ATP-binding protein